MPKKRNLVPSIRKAIDILELLAHKPNLSHKAIMTTLHIPNSTCFNILATLEAHGMVNRDPDTFLYSLGPTVMRLGHTAYSQLDIRNLALPIMRWLNQQFDETVYLTILDRSAMQGVVIEKIDSSQTTIVLRQLGEKVPLYASCTGKSLLSGFDDAQLEEYFDSIELIPFSPTTITDKQTLLRELDAVRRNGYAITRNELNDGAASVSAPVFDYRGRVIAAISCAGPVERMEGNIPMLIPIVVQGAKTISTRLGYSG